MEIEATERERVRERERGGERGEGRVRKERGSE